MTAIPVDLVIVIDTSVSVKAEAEGLSQAAETAIANARSHCPSDLRVIWLGIEGTWKNTQFERTVRDYLSKTCAIPESALKSRKKGELPSGGAQEDAARVMQDLATHFDWRTGAKRAIFYLGDEALDAGGDKTLAKDIEAANQAIQGAKTAQVIIHTYCGQSKSRYRHTIEAEYARVAQETGGQSFTDEGSLRDFATVLEQIICGSQSLPQIPLTEPQNNDTPTTALATDGDPQPVLPQTHGEHQTMSKSKDSTESAPAAANVTQPTPEKPKTEQPETTEPKTKYIPATGLEDYGRWKTMFKDRKANPNDPPFRRGRIWS
jgi:cyanobactin cluster PatC/TenC/TruC protein